MKLEPNGFREYDARWRYPEHIDDDGMRALGFALGTYLNERGKQGKIILGHDYRSYSQTLKQEMAQGLMDSGQIVLDIGLCLSPTAYFAQAELGVASVAMVTASHNENGWTGVKMGCQAPLTFGPDEMKRLKEIALNHKNSQQEKISGGRIEKIDSIQERYMQDLISSVKIKRKLRVVLACGNGTAGNFAPKVFQGAGCEVIPLHCNLDWDFPHYTPNPENMKMMTELSDCVKNNKADIGLAFDGDGDRCGYVDDSGNIIFADKIAVLVARHLSSYNKNSTFIADVKSTGIFNTDPELAKNQARTLYWITGHSYMKRKLNESGALAGFEKSGHFFFAPPVGRGYDDGLLSGLLVCALIAESDKPLSEIYKTLPQSFITPTMAPSCPDEKKYQAVEKIAEHFEKQDSILGRAIVERLRINGIRLTLEDGSWILARASSNVPSLVIVAESTKSKSDMKALFDEIDRVISTIDEIGDYDQKL